MSKVKEILCLAHSHLDVGYTHPQNMLMELQGDYLDQAIDLCLETEGFPEPAQFRWSCEAALPVLQWFETADEERKHLLRRLVKEGKISLCAFPLHFTPNVSSAQLAHWFSRLDELRRLTGAPIRTAISHDVNGVPWTVAGALLDSGVDCLIAGPNVHFGGIPFPRPYLFNWRTPNGRALPFFLGEHYSLFSQFFFTRDDDTAKMQRGIREYVTRVEAAGWNRDWVYLTATNPPLYDNNSPDANLADLIRRYNAEGHEWRVRFVTPEMLYARIAAEGLDALPVHAGDWTDYWNFGTASTARETKLNRRAKVLLNQSEFLACRQNLPYKMRKLAQTAYADAMLFDEHTWGTYDSVTAPDNEESGAQLLQKRVYAQRAAERAAYLAGQALERFLGNPVQADAEAQHVIVNPTGETLFAPILRERGYRADGRTLAAERVKAHLPYARTDDRRETLGYVEMPPFSVKRLPAKCPVRAEDAIRETPDGFETPFYRVTLDPVGKEIAQIYDLRAGRNMLSPSQWKFFDIVEESVDPDHAEPVRESIFCRDVELGNRSVSQWKRAWVARRVGAASEDMEIKRENGDIALCYHGHNEHLAGLTRTVRFSSAHPHIKLEVSFTKRQERAPLGVYAVVPLALKAGWKGYYDSADALVELDGDQLGHACRDYVTVDRAAAMFDDLGGAVLACPDAPMVQFGDFNFGREYTAIARNPDPLLLGWVMNNYWNTNFPASEDGWMRFGWELTGFTSFTPKAFRQAGVQAQNPCLQGAAIRPGDKAEETLIRVDGAHTAALFTMPLMNRDGFMLALQNMGDSAESCHISPARGSAARTDLLGNVQEMLSIQDGAFTLTLAAREIAWVEMHP